MSNLVWMDIYSILCIVLGVFISVSNIKYFIKVKKVEPWIEVRLLTLFSALYFVVVFSLSIFDIFPKGIIPIELGRPGILMLMTTLAVASLYGVRK